MELQKFTCRTALTHYIPLPRPILELNLPSTAILLYGVLLDRGTLSQKNGYCDAGGWVYVVYPLEELSRLLRTSTRMLKRHMTLLEQAGLVRKVRKSRKLANQYYLYLPGDCVMGTGTGHPYPAGGTDSVQMKGHPVPPNNIRKQHNMINLYQHSEEESL